MHVWPTLKSFPQRILRAATLRSIAGSMKTGDLPPSLGREEVICAIRGKSSGREYEERGDESMGQRENRGNNYYLECDGREMPCGGGSDNAAYTARTCVKNVVPLEFQNLWTPQNRVSQWAVTRVTRIDKSDDEDESHDAPLMV